jgi:putative heme-binding domain-containing protein
MPVRKLLLIFGSIGLFLAVLHAQEDGPSSEKRKNVRNPFAGDKSAVEAGRSLFGAGCTVCHGPTGQGGRGLRLADVERVRQMRDPKMFDIIKDGVPGTQMPPSPLADQQIWQLVSFIRSLNAGAVDQDVPGDVGAGEALFYGSAKCAACHMIRGRGGLIGPDLSDIGASRSLEKLKQSLEDPDASVALGFRQVSAVTLGGRRISGVAKNNSSYSIQIQDAAGQFHLLMKRDLRELVHQKSSLMPKPSLSETEMQNLLAFLSRQSIESPAERAKRVEHGKEVEP